MEKYNYVLYIEDDEDDVMVFTESFKTVSDLPVKRLQDASQLKPFLQIEMEGHLPCLLVMDNNLPKYTGIELLKQLRNQEPYSDLPVAIFSTSLSHTDRDTCKNLGARIVIKPSTFKEWQEVSRSLVQHCHLIV